MLKALGYLLCLGLGCLTLVGCQDEVAPLPASGASPGASAGAPGGGGSSSPASSPEFHAAPAGLRPLTLSQYEDTLSDLLGQVTLPPRQTETSSVAASRSGFSPLLVEQFETAALAAAEQVFASPERRAALIACVPSAAAGDACVHQFLSQFGRRVFRRPLEADELDRYTALVASAASTLGDVFGGLQAAVTALFESPYFLYRVELGEPATDGDLRFTNYEMAGRLAYFFWNGAPDDTLLASAERGELVSLEGLQTAVDRALADARARRGVSRFASDWLELWGLSDLQKDRTALPLMSDTLGEAFRTEIMLDLEDLVFTRDADAHELFSGTSTFVNGELARLYGLPESPSSGFAKVTFATDSARAGLLGWGGILALRAKPKKTFPTSRGKFIRMALLCQTIPPPPPNVNTSLNLAQPGEVLTTRQLLERHRANPACAGCHALTDPLGLALEHFDALGAYRATEDGLSIDTSGDLDGVAFNDARELEVRLSERPETMGCIARQLFRFATGHVETAGEQVAMSDLEARFATSNFHLKDAMRQVVLSDAFRRATP